MAGPGAGRRGRGGAAGAGGRPAGGAAAGGDGGPHRGRPCAGAGGGGDRGAGDAWWPSIRCGSGCGGCWCWRCTGAGGRPMRWRPTGGRGTMLAEELGIEPGEELRALEQAVLRQEVPAAAPHRARHNLPVRLTSFVGREQELAAVAGLVGGARLVTLTGAGGAGKTRLALEFAAGVVDRFPDGVWLAELAGIADAGLVPSLVMEALGVRQSGEVPVIEALRLPAAVGGAAAGAGQLRASARRLRGSGRRRCWAAARGCGCWRPAASRWAFPGRPPTRCRRWRCRRSRRSGRASPVRLRCGCS